MALIQWQANAKRHLRQIFDYYKGHASVAVAQSMSIAIIESIDRLESFPTSGIIDYELSTEDITYYYVIAEKGNRTYRVYYIYENDICSILAIWDCSMNPSKRVSRVAPTRRHRKSGKVKKKVKKVRRGK